MKNRVLLAIACSVILISLAFYTRFERTQKLTSELAIVQSSQTEDYQALLEEYLSKSSSTSTPVTKKPLSTTDLISRQIIVDYVNLATDGQATEKNVNNLVNQYLEDIPSLVAAQKITYLEINIVPSSKTSLAKYKSEFETIYNSYATRIMDVYSGKEAESLGIFSKYISEPAKGVYIETAQKLKAVAVPTEIAEAHLELINIFLENAAASEMLIKIADDPMLTLSGLLAIKNNSNKEVLVIAKISKIFDSAGI